MVDEQVQQPFKVIKPGKAMVARKQGSKEETVAALIWGKSFGDHPLVPDALCTASATITSNGVLMALESEDLRDLLQASVIRKVTEEEVEQMEEDGDRACVTIDVRLPMEYKHDRPPGARNIPLNELRPQLKSLDKDLVYIVSWDGRRRGGHGGGRGAGRGWRGQVSGETENRHQL